MMPIPRCSRWWWGWFERFKEPAHCLISTISTYRGKRKGKDLRAEIWSVGYIAHKSRRETPVHPSYTVRTDYMAAYIYHRRTQMRRGGLLANLHYQVQLDMKTNLDQFHWARQQSAN
jgi:hypothetical protein